MALDCSNMLYLNWCGFKQILCCQWIPNILLSWKQVYLLSIHLILGLKQFWRIQIPFARFIGFGLRLKSHTFLFQITSKFWHRILNTFRFLTIYFGNYWALYYFLLILRLSLNVPKLLFLFIICLKVMTCCCKLSTTF